MKIHGYFLFFYYYFFSLAVVMPEYSKYYIQARMGDTIMQAQCEYNRGFEA